MKLAVIGTGKIVHDALFALSVVDEVQTVAIFGRPHSKEKAKELAEQYQIAEIYTDYDKLLAKTAADTVYIGLVNSVHYEYAKKALLSGKHVILEKPFTLLSQEAIELKNLAQASGLFLFEAITSLHTRVFQKMEEVLPKLGKVKMVLANFSQYSSRYDEYLAGQVTPVFDPAYNGGALNDINVYNIHYCAALFGLPEKVQYYPNYGFNGVDTSGTLVLSYPGFTAVCTAAKDSDSPCFVSIQGEQGWLRVDDKPNAAQVLDIAIAEKGKAGRDTAGASVRNMCREHLDNRQLHHRMSQEFVDFARIIAKKDYARRDKLLAETVTVVKILEMAWQSVRG